MKKEKRVLVLEVSNNQADYAMCLELIQAIEKKRLSSELEIIKKNCILKWGKLPDSESKSGIYGSTIRTRLVDNLERILYEEIDKNIDVFQNFQLDSEKKQMAYDADMYYYIRITSKDDSDIVALQYLFAMLQGLGEISERVICFFVPFDGYYNAIGGDFTLYYKISHYLRLVPHKNFFSAFYTEERGVVRAPLTSKKIGIQKTFLPLIEIDKDTYEIISSNVLKEQNNDTNFLTELKDIANKMLEIRFKSKEYAVIKSLMKEHLKKENRYTLLEYLLFACLFTESREHELVEQIQMYMHIIRELAEGMLQLMENVVQHSMLKKGVFSFRVHEKNSTYIQSGVNLTLENLLSFLEVGIIDYNTKETMIDNFLNKKGVNSEKIFNYGKRIEVKQFLRLTEDTDLDNELYRAWEEYRKNYPVNCMGLPKLANNLKKYGAFLFMKSHKGYKIGEDRFLFSHNFNQDKIQFKKEANCFFIPGTQYKIIFPVKGIYASNHNSDIFTNLLGNLKENDNTYARFFDYEAKKFPRLNIAELLQESHRIYAEKTEAAKDESTIFWIKEINAAYRKIKNKSNKVFYLDVDVLCERGETWSIETFCKGIVGSQICRKGGLPYFAFVNCSHLFVKTFYDTFLLGKEEDNAIQIYLVEKNVEKELLIAGKNDSQIKSNIMQYSFMRGPMLIDENLQANKDSDVTNIDIMPFDVLLKQKTNKQETIFDEYISKVGSEQLTNFDKAGYMISDTHMRLGSKVHLGAFYEMAILLQKPRVARKIAFQILRDIVAESGESILYEKIVFYGYASYSRVILESIMEIAEALKMKKDVEHDHKNVQPLDWGFVVYQNDIIVQKASNRVGPVENIYFNSFRLKESIDKYKIVQVVPISSTLTTFNKMWAELKNKMSKMQRTLKNEAIINNYTVFWVRDSSIFSDEPSEIEREYWSGILEERRIKTDLIKPYPKYFCVGSSEWQDPLKCKWCYPKQVIDERTLIETDPTSTVPTLQVEKVKSGLKKEEDIKNSERVINLESSLKYGHIQRDNNHFQYYIDTNEYFVLEKDNIKDWIKGIPKGRISNKLSIIVSPQHHTNVEFCHYINNYYFGGIADIISFDATKDYKSNILAKYADVKATINQAKEKNIKVSFIYVDDTIITGTTFKRVNNLIHTLLPDDMKKTVQIDEVFVLLNRLSESSKKNYVENPESKYHAYVNLDISSIRNYGTSCMMCGLKRDANLFKRRASTKYISEYWNMKEYDYAEVSFDEVDGNRCHDIQKRGFFRMLCSHYASDRFERQEEKSETILKIIDLFLELKLNKTHPSPIYRKVFSDNVLLTIQSYIKVLNRPYFSYGKNFRQSMLDVMLVLTECFISKTFRDKLYQNKNISKEKTYLNKKNVQEKFVELYQLICEQLKPYQTLDFLENYLLEGLTDLKSNYIIRQSTFKKLCLFLHEISIEGIEGCKIEEFWEKLQINIHRLVNSSTDETKTLWLEYLLVTGKEYQNSNAKTEQLSMVNLDKQFSDGLNDVVKSTFNHFWEDMYIENTRLYYDGTLRFVDKWEDDLEVEELVEQLWGDYYIKNLISLMRIDFLRHPHSKDSLTMEIKKQIGMMVEFLDYIKHARHEDIDKYTNVSQKMKAMLPDAKDLCIIIGEYNMDPEEDSFYNIPKAKDQAIKETVLKNITNAIGKKESFEKTGYFVGDNYVVIVIKNNYDFLHSKQVVNIGEQKIAPVYIHIEIETREQRKVLSTIRTILMFRNQLLKLFGVDFNNNSMHVLAKQRIKNQQLARDKAGDHSSIMDLNSIQYALQYKGSDKNYCEIIEWLLLKAYVNMRIARLFRWYLNDCTSIERVYTSEENTDYWRASMKNIGEGIFSGIYQYCADLTSEKSEHLEFEVAPSNYFKLIDNMLNIRYDFFGEKGETEKFEEMREPLKKLECINVNGKYYRREFIICIFLDICFSAINNSIPWETELEIPMSDQETIERYLYFKGQKERKCVLEISTEICDQNKEIAYLVFKNLKVLESGKTIKECKKELERSTAKNMSGNGFSLWAIQRYIESIWDANEDAIQVSYEYIEVNNQYYFVAKLPIIRSDEK